MLQFEEKELKKATFKKWSEWEIGDSIVGKVTKAYESIVKGKNYGMKFVVKLSAIDFTNNEGDYPVNVGDKFEIGCGVITSQYDDGYFEVGDICKFTYKGMQAGKEGNEYHLVTVVPASNQEKPAAKKEETVDSFDEL